MAGGGRHFFAPHRENLEQAPASRAKNGRQLPMKKLQKDAEASALHHSYFHVNENNPPLSV
jgi:hypothetical protein